MIAASFDTFLLDLDGVVYIGTDPVPGAARTIARLREQGKTLRFLTNDPRPTRQQVAERLRRIGIQASAHEITTCGSATAAHLKTSALQTVFVVGSDGLRQEMEAAGVAVRDTGDVDAVVVGCDETVGYHHIRKATQRIIQGAHFIATNDDPTFPTPDGPAPATGAIVAAVQTAAGRTPRIIGKPSPDMFAIALEDQDGARSVMIGDQLATDIAGAQRYGIASLWFNYKGERSVPDDPPAQPDGILTRWTELFEADRAARGL
jgi:HAD superfamily hydrolase (TIGR01450 family)